jgi:hypothetical protein
MNKTINEEVYANTNYLKILKIKFSRNEMSSFKKWLETSMRIVYKQGVIDGMLNAKKILK